jgi:hypothetical protein
MILSEAEKINIFKRRRRAEQSAIAIKYRKSNPAGSI